MPVISPTRVFPVAVAGDDELVLAVGEAVLDREALDRQQRLEPSSSRS